MAAFINKKNFEFFKSIHLLPIIIQSLPHTAMDTDIPFHGSIWINSENALQMIKDKYHGQPTESINCR